MKNKKTLDPRIKKLTPAAFMAYFLLVEKAGDNGVIENFTIRALAREWNEDLSLGIVKNKDSIRKVINELDSAELILIRKKRLEIFNEI